LSKELTALLFTAAAVGFIHTLTGPDHYVPFVAMSRAAGWSRGKTALVTVLCGLGHVGSSVVLGLIGIALGLALSVLQALETMRGTIAGWALVAFGLVYFVWGMRRAARGRRHSHLHAHPDGTLHAHEHAHVADHVHAHPTPEGGSLTPWVLFTIFVFGPCEPLIPLLIYPAASRSAVSVALVAGVFGATTILTMLSLVTLALRGVELLPTRAASRYAHAAAGLALLLCGLAVQLLGL